MCTAFHKHNDSYLAYQNIYIRRLAYSSQKVYVPETKLIAENFGVSVTKTVIANSSPAAIVVNFQASFVCQPASDKSHYTSTTNI